MLASHLARIRIILFDVGNTLTYVDLERVGEVLESCGLPFARERLEPAEEVARATMYRHYDERPASSDRERWTVYLETMLEHVGIRDRAQVDQVRSALAELHAKTHLWRRVANGARATLHALGRRGYRLGAVSNSDGRVAELLEEVRLAPAFEVIIDSHHVGVEKPDPRIFEIALARFGGAAFEAIYVGDFYAVDVLGARRAGVEPVLFDPLRLSRVTDCPVIHNLEDLHSLLPDRAPGC
jgi:putative hydrolase of the HAD superfamily